MVTKNKQFGKYDGGIFKDSTYVLNCTEQELYFMINNFGEMLWRLNHDMADGRIEENLDLIPYQYAIEFCIMHTPRFGVQIEEPKEGEHVKPTVSYWAWYNWWNEYFQTTLTQEEYNQYVFKSEKNEDISLFRPKGDWRENI